MAEATEKKKRAEKRTKKQQCMDLIVKCYSDLSGFKVQKSRIEKILEILEAEAQIVKKNKKPSVKRLINGKSKQQIQALIEALQAEL